MTQSNNFFTGTVLSADATTYVVQVAPHGCNHVQVMQGLPLSSAFSRLLGFRDCFLPSPGSKVFCFQNDLQTCVIIGVIPDRDECLSYPLRTIVGAGDGNGEEQNRMGYVDQDSSKLFLVNNNRPTDVVPGEHVVANEFGVLLGLFQQLAVLKGSDLAQVQAFLLDDLVRVVSHNFQHYTAMGEHRVFHDGKDLQIEFNLTHRPAEALGTPETAEKAVSVAIRRNGEASVDDTSDFYSVEKEQQTGIARIKGFVGSISRLLNIMLVRPADGQTRQLDGTVPKAFDTGLAALQMSAGGSVRLASRSDLSIEKTNWIRVPHRIREPEDPSGEVEPEDKDERTPFKFDETRTISSVPHLYFLQIRDYLSYVFDGDMLGGYRSRPKDFALNDKPENETPLGKDTDIEPGLKHDYINRSAGVYIMPNGGIMLRDAWGSAIVMEGGSIYLQPARDLFMQPLRNMIGKVGGDLSLAARKDMEFSSTSGGLRMKGAQNVHLYSSESGVVLQSDAAGPYDPVQTDPEGPITGVGGIAIVAGKAGVFTQAALGSTRISGGQSVSVGGTAYTETQNAITRSFGSHIIAADQALAVYGGSSMQLASGGSTVVYGVVSTVVGVKNQTFATASAGPFQAAVQGVISPSDLTRYLDQVTGTLDRDFADYTPVFKTDDTFDSIRFRFQTSDHYGVGLSDVIPQTIAQQEDKNFSLHGLTAWVEKDVNGTFPYPGTDRKDSLLQAPINNLANGSTGLHNLADDHTGTAAFDGPVDLFKNYMIYGS